MALAHLIIDGRRHGLPHAAAFYGFFPNEQSPLGLLEFKTEHTTVLTSTTLSSVFDAMIKAGNGAVIVLVCHAYQDGILIPVSSADVPDGLATAKTMRTLDAIMTAVLVHGVVVPNLPAKTDEEIAIVVSRWKELFDKINVTYPPDLTLKRAEELYNEFLDHYAKQFGLAGKQQLLTLIYKIQQVRNLKISRLELRACNLGKNKAAMESVRNFFGATTLTAPKVGTFFGSQLRAGVIALGNPPSYQGINGAAVIAGPRGINVNSTQVVGEVRSVDSDAEMRGFFRETFTPPTPKGARVAPPSIDFYRLTLKVHEEAAYQYSFRMYVTGHRHGRRMETDNDILRKFVTGFMMAASKYQGGDFPLAGLWTKDDAQGVAFVLPAEGLYLKLIVQSP